MLARNETGFPGNFNGTRTGLCQKSMGYAVEGHDGARVRPAKADIAEKTLSGAGNMAPEAVPEPNQESKQAHRTLILTLTCPQEVKEIIFNLMNKDLYGLKDIS
ncbi:hypothetical protein J6590_047363 [Homalodisca vitripennis]|nr:hypothetical protein J6590_047363 [Homalodisca vitripennis]